MTIDRYYVIEGKAEGDLDYEPVSLWSSSLAVVERKLEAIQKRCQGVQFQVVEITTTRRVLP